MTRAEIEEALDLLLEHTKRNGTFHMVVVGVGVVLNRKPRHEGKILVLEAMDPPAPGTVLEECPLLEQVQARRYEYELCPIWGRGEGQGWCYRLRIPGLGAVA